MKCLGTVLRYADFPTFLCTEAASDLALSY